MFQIRAVDKKVKECFETMLSIDMHLLFQATHSIIIYQKNIHYANGPKNPKKVGVKHDLCLDIEELPTGQICGH